MKHSIAIIIFLSIQLSAQSNDQSHILTNTFPAISAEGQVQIIAVNENETLMAVARTDKGIVVYDINSKTELRKIYLPSNAARAGEISAISFLNSTTIVCGDRSGLTPDDFYAYVIDVSNGKVLKRIANLPNAVCSNGISLNRDKSLALFSYNSHGFEVFKTSDWSKTFSGFSESTKKTGAAFNPKNQILAINDGKAILYSESFSKIIESRIDNENPQIPVFSSSETFLLTSQSSVNADIYSSVSLAKIKSINFNINRPSFFAQPSFCMSRNSFSISGSLYPDNAIKSSNLIFINPVSGVIVEKSTIPTGSTTSTSIVKNALYSGDSIGNIFIYNNTKYSVFHTSSSAQIVPTNNSERLRMFNNEMTVIFNNKIDKNIYEFNLNTMSYKVKGIHIFGIIEPKLSSNSIRVSNADYFSQSDTQKPTVNNEPIKLDNGEKALSYAIRRDDKGFYLCVANRIDTFSINGNKISSIQTKASLTDIINNSDDSVCIASMKDGTIRWYRTKDGRELLAFFPHADGRKWAAWTPNGYYVCGENSQDLIGWQLNQRLDKEALYIPSSVFSDYLNKPEVIREVISKHETDDEVVKRLGISTENVQSLAASLIELQKPISETIALKGTAVGRIFSVNPEKRIIIIASSQTVDPIKIKETLYVMIDGKKVFLSADFPMIASAKCNIDPKTAMTDIVKIKRGMQVFK